MKLPPERNFDWPLKALDTARTEVSTLPTGQTELMIEHETVEGITTEMLSWWFERFPHLTVTKAGVDYPAYHLWHPSDHISVRAVPDEKLRVGNHLIINEAFQRKTEFHVHERAEVSYLDQDGIGLTIYKLGRPVVQLDHRFDDVPDGVRYHSRMVVGVDRGLLKPLINRVMVPRKFGPEKARAWLQHNIEEVGCFENFLQRLFANRHQGEHISL